MIRVGYSLDRRLSKKGGFEVEGANTGVATANDGGQMLLVYDRPDTAGVYAGIYDTSLERTHGPTAVGGANQPDQVGDAAALNNGTYAVVYQHSGSRAEVRVRRLGADGTVLGKAVTLDEGASLPETQGSVAALSNGGFVATFTKDFGGGDLDVNYEVFDAQGNVVKTSAVDSDTRYATSGASVAGLANGGFVVAYTQTDVGGSGEGIYFQRFNARNEAVGGKVAADPSPAIKEEVQTLGLADGGFAMVYKDSGWDGGASGTDITLAIYDRDGTNRVFDRVNSSDLFHDGGNTDGTQRLPTITQLQNGDIVVGWESFDVGQQTNLINARVFASDGSAVTDIETLGSTIYNIDPSFTTQLYEGFTATWTSTDGGKDVITGAQVDLVRSSAGTNASEDIDGDDLVDRVDAGGGSDNVFVFGGNDLVNGSKGNDFINGGDGDDFLLGGTGKDFLAGSDGHDFLSGGTGADTFFFNSRITSANRDRIKDFVVGQDKIGVAGSAYEALGRSIDKGEFVVASKAADGNDYLIYNSATGGLFYDADGSGAKAQQEIATLSKGLDPTYRDFKIIFQ